MLQDVEAHPNKVNWAVLVRNLLLSELSVYDVWVQQGVGGAQWLSGRVLDSRPKGHGFEPHRRHCVVSLSKSINPSLVLVQPRKTRPSITERLLMGRKESNQTNKQQGVGPYSVFISLCKQRLTDNCVQNLNARLQTHSRGRVFFQFVWIFPIS